MFIEEAILLSYIITVFSETVIILFLQRPVKICQWILAIFLINSLTHPLTIYFINIQNTLYIPIEIGVFIVEMIWYKLAFKLKWKRSLIISGIANIFSILVGMSIKSVFGL